MTVLSVVIMALSMANMALRKVLSRSTLSRMGQIVCSPISSVPHHVLCQQFYDPIDPIRDDFRRREQSFNRGGRWEDSLRALGQNLKDKEWDKIQLEKFSSDVFRPSRECLERNEEEVEEFLKKNDITVVRSGSGGVPKPTMTFDEVGFPDEIVAKMVRLA